MSGETQPSSVLPSCWEGTPLSVPVVCIGPLDEDQFSLKRIVSRPETVGSPQWRLQLVSTLTAALALCRTMEVPIVICDRDVGSSTWKDVLRELFLLPDPPLLIVSCRGADERLWAEALNLGAYDVLTKPFAAIEVIRVLDSAWFHKANALKSRNRTVSVEGPG